MRKVLSTLLIAGALVIGLSSLANGAQGPRCGTLYTPTCTRPHITARGPAGCRAPKKTFQLSPIRFSSNAGIRRITVKLGSKILKSKHFSGRGPTQYTVRHLKVHTTGLASGGHTITISVTDVKGKTTRDTIRFTVCPPPKFTG